MGLRYKKDTRWKWEFQVQNRSIFIFTQYFFEFYFWVSRFSKRGRFWKNGLNAGIMTWKKRPNSDCLIFEFQISTSVHLVEMAGIEPASENRLLRLSTSVAGVLAFPCGSAQRQAQPFSSLFVMTRVKAFPCSRSPLIDAFLRAVVLPGKTAA